MLRWFVSLVLAVIWLVYIKASEEATGIGQGNLLSPVDNTPLVLGLIIFTIGYLFFLGMMFSSNIKEMIANYRRRRGY
ncbi:hypothetical protein J4209_03255 [Candidatus Woesearchaeota archaeon]|nr:hypothetical protein [Candidatus Woesearchaeota archaeon]